MEEIRERKYTNGAHITRHIQRIYKERGEDTEFKKVQRRVSEVLSVLAALNIIIKNKSKVEWVGIFVNDNDHI